MSSDTTYNGWTNRATWNVMLWLNNDEGLYRSFNEYRREHGQFTPTTAQEFCENVFDNGVTPDRDHLSDVNWQEIADAMNEE